MWYWGDDYSISKALRMCIMTMKRGELCELVCKMKGEGRNRLKYGRDYQSIIDYDKEIETVKYYILLKDFTEVFYMIDIYQRERMHLRWE